MISPLHVLDVVLALAALLPAWLAFRTYKLQRTGTQYYLGIITGIAVSIVIILIFGWILGI